MNLASVYSFNIMLLNNDNIIYSLMRDEYMPVYVKLAVPVGFAFVGVALYPFMILPMTAPLKKKLNDFQYKMLNLGLIVASVAIPAIPTDPKVLALGDINEINGALSVFLFLGFFPAVVGYKLLGWNKWPLVALSIVTFAAGAAQIYFTSESILAKMTTKVVKTYSENMEEMNNFYRFDRQENQSPYANGVMDNQFTPSP